MSFSLYALSEPLQAWEFYFLQHCSIDLVMFLHPSALCSLFRQLDNMCWIGWCACCGQPRLHWFVVHSCCERCRISVDSAVVTVNWKEGKRMWGKVWRIEGKTLVNRKHQFKIISCLLHCYAPFICLTKHFCWFRLHYSLFNNNMLHAST